MKHVLFVCDNTALRKRVAGALAQAEDWALHSVPFSTNFFEEFMQSNAPIVLLDSQTVMPTTAILQQIRLSKRPHHVILLGQAKHSKKQIAADVTVLPKSRINEQTLLDAMREAYAHTGDLAQLCQSASEQGLLQYVTLCPGCAVPLQSDMYTLMVAVYVGDALNLVQKEPQIALLFALLGEPEGLLIQETRLVLCVRNQKLTCAHPATRAKQLLTDNISDEFVFFTAQSLHWYALKEGFDALAHLSGYSYFFKGQEVRLRKEFKPNQTVEALQLTNTVAAMVKNVLMQDRAQTRALANDLYLHTVKTSASYKVLGCVRLCMELMDTLFCALLRLTALPTAHHRTVEGEYFALQQRLVTYAQARQSGSVSEDAIRAICLVLDEYQSPLWLDQAANRINRTKTQTSRLFAKQIGIHYLDFLHAVRMNLVQCALILTDKKVLEIAPLAGYTDLHYFSRLFKKRMGCTAEQYRQSTCKRLEQQNL